MCRIAQMGEHRDGKCGFESHCGIKLNNMEFFGNIIAVTFEELTRDDDGGAIMSIQCYRSLQRRGQINVLRPGKGLGSPALIEYSSMPTRFRERFCEKYGDPTQQIREERKMLKFDEKARIYFAQYVLPDGSYLKEDKQSEYVINASVLNHLCDMENTQRRMRKMHGNSTPVNWEAIYGESDRLRDEYGHTLPQSTSRLRDKMRQYRKEGYDCLVSRKLTNENSVKITAAAARWLIARKCCKTPVLTISQIFELYNETAPSKGWKPLQSQSTLLAFFQRPDVMIKWKASEGGELKARLKYDRQHSTHLPTRRDTLWYGDGTRLNLYYKAYRDGRYVLATTTVYEVADAYSETLLGYAISPVESFEVMRTAFRNAIEFAGQLPYEAVYDNQGGTKRADAQIWLAQIATVSRPTAPYNARSKSIEAIFKRFQEQVLRQIFGFTGQNITAKMDSSKIDREFIEANADKLPTYNELLVIYAEARQKWNSMNHPKYNRPRCELYAESVNSECTQLNEVLRRELFWNVTERPSKFTAGGITIQVDRQTYTYEVFDADGNPDFDWRSRHTGREFHVQYDPQDMSVVRLCTKDKYGLQFVTEAMPYAKIHRAIQDQQEGEAAFIRAMERQNKKERVRRQLESHALMYEHGVAPEQHGYRMPKLKGISDAEFEMFADEIRREDAAESVAEATTIEPVTIGASQKQISYLDEADIWDRM